MSNQISARVSASTKTLVEEYAAEYGVKKGHLIEQALLHHLQALRELPLDVIIPPRLVISRKSMERVAELIAEPQEPNPALRALFEAD